MDFETIIQNLFYAIQTHNLEETQKYVDILNSIPSERDMFKFLELYAIVDGAFNNLCYDYILLHLNTIDKETREITRWEREINKMIYSGKYNDNDIKNFILKQISHLDYQISTQQFIRGLYKLARNINAPEQSLLMFQQITKLKEELNNVLE